MTTDRGIPIAISLVRLILLVSLLIALVATVIQLYVGFAEDRDTLHEQLEKVEASYIPALAESLWLYDEVLLRSQVLGIKALPGIVYVHLRGGEMDIQEGRESDAETLIRYRHRLVKSFRGKDLQIGTIEIAASLEGAWQRVYRSAWVIFLTQGFKAFIVMGFMLLLFHFRIGRPLSQLTDRAKKAMLDIGASDGFFIDRPWGAGSGPDELDELGRTLNAMLVRHQQDFQQIRSASDALRKEVRQRERAETQLRQTEKMQAVGRLAAGIAHDFNNQLCGILGYADLLVEDLEGKETLQQYANNIKQASLRASDLTRQLLAFARKGKFLSQDFDLHGAIDEAAKMLERSLDKRIRVTTSLHAASPMINGDPSQIHNLLLNLGINAGDAMPGGGVLTFTTEDADLDLERIEAESLEIDAGRYIRLDVADTGTGMTEEVQAKTFEPFFTTKEKGKGTGLGLASVYGAMRNHQGAVTVRSRPGQGTTFSLFFPVSRAGKDEEAEPLPRHTIHGRDISVLLVDDEEVVRNLGADILTRLGYVCQTCADGEEAVRVFGHQWESIDLVILDLGMPRLDGVDTYRALREICPDVRVLVTSGYSASGKAQTVIHEGALGFLSKPFVADQLEAELARIFA